MSAPPPAPPVASIAATIHAGVPLAAAWGVEVLHAADGVALCRLPRRTELLRPGGTVSGPALMGLADVAVWAALLGVTGGRDESVTASMNVHFLRPAGPGPVLAEARLIKRGRRMVYAEVTLRAEGSDAPCARIGTSWAVIAPAAEPRA